MSISRVISFSQRLFLSVLLLFLSFAACFLIYQYQREKAFRIEVLNTRLQSYNIQMYEALTENRHAWSDSILTRYTTFHTMPDLRVTIINSVNDGKATLTQSDIDELKDLFTTYLVDILGIRTDIAAGGDTQVLEPFEKAVDLLLQIRKESKEKKDWATSDLIRNRLAEIGFDVKDTKDGFEWSLRK